jgi:hypothetical protein
MAWMAEFAKLIQTAGERREPVEVERGRNTYSLHPTAHPATRNAKHRSGLRLAQPVVTSKKTSREHLDVSDEIEAEPSEDLREQTAGARSIAARR